MSKYIHYYFFLVCLFCVFSVSSTEVEQVVTTQSAESGKLKKPIAFLKSNNNRFYASEFPDWDTPDVVEDSWWPFDKNVRAYDYKGIFWASFDVYLTGDGPPDFDWEYNLHMLAATEVYWDGVKLGQNGRPAMNKEAEIPGMTWTSFLIPNHLMTPGKHVLKIKASSHYRSTGMKLIKEGWIQPFDPQFRFVSLGSLVPSLLVSISAVIGLYFLMLFFTEGRQWEHLIFFLLLENITMYGFAIQWEHLVGYTYDLEWINLLLERVSTIAILLLLPTYFLFKHKANNKVLWLISAIGIIYVLSKVVPFFTGYFAWFGTFATAFVISVYYGFKHKKHLWWESLGLLACMVGVAHQDLEDVFFYLPAFFCLVLFTHAITMQQRQSALRQAQLLESQLRAELLRKHIQPHFLLNTLTSLMEWIETDVERGSEFIAELADEFRLMSNMALKQVVELKDEIELCTRHLNLMSLRLQKSCKLLSNNLSGEEPIPPAIFHTLIENAFSHNVYLEREVVFNLSKKHLAGGLTEFLFEAPRGGAQESSFSKLGTGTGKQYIEARLSQSFGSGWQLSEVISDEYWTTKIIVDYSQLKPELDTDGMLELQS